MQRYFRVGFAVFAFAVTLPALPQPPATTVIRDVTVIPLTGGPALPATTVVIRGERIAALGPAGEIAIPAGARTVDGRGKFLVPGLIDMHVHLSKNRASVLGLFVINGVTTVRDMGGDYEELLRWRREVAAGARVGPRILLPGPILESVGNIERMRRDPPSARVEPFERMRIGIATSAEARATVARLASLEIDFVKIRTVQDQETYLAINAAASAHGLKVVGHAPGFPAQVILEAGQDGIEHGFPRPFADETREQRLAVWRRYAAAGVPITPTIVTGTAGLVPLDRLRAIVDDEAGAIEPRRRYLSKFLILDWREQVLETSAERQEVQRNAWEPRMNELREMREAGMEFLAGSDTGVINVYPGSSLHDELALFVTELRMTPAEAIEAATRRAARFLGLGDSIGTVERGKIADLVLLDADPLADVANLRRISAVVLRGQLYGREGLERIATDVLAAPDLRADDWGRAAN